MAALIERGFRVHRDVKAAAGGALGTSKPGVGLNPLDSSNSWAPFDNYIHHIAARCVNALAAKWSTKRTGFDAGYGTSATPWSRACVLSSAFGTVETHYGRRLGGGGNEDVLRSAS